MANNRTLTVIVLLSIFMARSHAKDFKEQMFLEGSDVTLWCGNVTNFKWDDLVFVVWNISTQSKKCYIGLSPTLDDTCKDGKSMHNSTDGVSLSISKISMQDEGVYTCDLSYKGGSYSLNISVSVFHLSAQLDPDKKTAVCTARYKNKAPTLHWEPASSVLPNNDGENGASFTIENRVYLKENVNISELVCVATNPSMSSPVQLNATLYSSASGYDKTSLNIKLIAIPLGLVCFILVSLAMVYVLLRKFNSLSTLKMLCCKSKISPPADDKPAQPADVEEVEPYASYIQRVNSIYNSSAELFNA
ncbi:cell surface glycoprotein CD200 receptor 1-A isoform X2 [Danio rerio]|uniref:Cell surface glycoprotein CD200 receptor 1-A isoform X2 n=1 Tax=Danio rerio TaxID=7955 RepID=A0A8M2BES3_DANRE|nr:cell surface glycoprotein CD200 receptor 1-A isoform X2 [Danio rerio]|eukprot:XP_005167482.1 cell surface glycoprotein CD200 receptor 1-A isoform X2 [Danio rerio]